MGVGRLDMSAAANNGRAPTRSCAANGRRLCAEPGDHLQRIAGARVVNHREIDVGDDHLAGSDRLAAGMRAEDFLGNSRAHYPSSSSDFGRAAGQQNAWREETVILAVFRCPAPRSPCGMRLMFRDAIYALCYSRKFDTPPSAVIESQWVSVFRA